MGWDIAGCNDTELITIADRLNKCKESKVMLDLELSNEEFKLRYIHKRKEMTAAKAKTRMNYIIPFTAVAVLCVVLIISSYCEIREAVDSGLGTDIKSASILMLIAILGLAICVFVCVKLWLPEFKMLGKLNPLGKNRDTDKGLVTFEVERQMSEERIAMLKAQIKDVHKEITRLSEQKRDREMMLFVQMKAKEEKAYGDNSGVNTLEKNEADSATNAFALKRDVLSNVQSEELLEHYTKELKALEREKASLEIKDKTLQDKIIDIDVQMSVVKRQIITFVLVAVGLAVIAGLFPGNAEKVLGLMWLIIVMPYFLTLFNKCKDPVILYLVEHEHKIIQDYAFTQSLTPLYKKRNDLVQDIADCARRINYYQEKKEELL